MELTKMRTWNVKYTDNDLKNKLDNVEDEVIVYDNVELNDVV